MITVIFLSTGYVESQRACYIWFTHPQGFNTPLEAIKNLAEDIRKSWKQNETNTYYDRCCIKNKGMNFCPECGSKIGTEEFDEEAFQDMIASLPGETCDGWPLEEGCWWPWTSLEQILKIDRSEILIVRRAEDILTACVVWNKEYQKQLNWCAKKHQWDGLPTDWQMKDETKSS